MSADNFYHVEDRKVWMGFASDYHTFLEDEKDRLLAEHAADIDRRFYKQLRQHHPIHIAESHEEARDWALSEYSEYGVWGELAAEQEKIAEPVDGWRLCCRCNRPAVVEIAIHVWTLPNRVHDSAVRLYCMKHNPDPLAAEFDVEPIDR